MSLLEMSELSRFIVSSLKKPFDDSVSSIFNTNEKKKAPRVLIDDSNDDII